MMGNEQGRSEIFMPVTDDHALRQFEIEALRQITDNLKRLNDKMDVQSDKMNAMDVRLARIESNRIDGDVSTIRQTQIKAIERIGAIELELAQTKGATGVVGTILRSPTLGWLVGAAITAWAILTGKVTV